MDKLLAPGQLQMHLDSTNFWGIGLECRADAEFLGTRQHLFLEKVASDPSQFGFKGSPDEKAKLQVAATYAGEEQTAVAIALINSTPGRISVASVTDAAIHENSIVSLYQANIRSRRDFLPADQKRGIEDINTSIVIAREEVARTQYAERAVRDQNQARLRVLEELRHNYADALLGPVVAKLLRRANLLSTEQVAWEQSHGTLNNEGRPVRAVMLDFPDTLDAAVRGARRALRRAGNDGLSPAELATRMELPNSIAGAVISELASFGLVRRSMSGEKITRRII